MSGNNVQKSKSPRPIAIAPAPERSQPSSSSSIALSIPSGGNELNGKRKLAPRPSDETIKPLIKIQPNNNIKKDPSPTNNNNGKIAPASAPLPSQQLTTTTSSAAAAATAAGQMMFQIRPVSNPNQRMFPSYFSASAHPHLQQRLQAAAAAIDPNGNIINNNQHQILTENQLQQLQQQQQHQHQRNLSLSQTLSLQQHHHHQQQQQQHQQRPNAPIPIAPRPSSISSTPSTSEVAQTTTPASSSTASSSTIIKPPKICPRPIEKKPLTNISQSSTAASTAAAAMNITPQNIIPTPQLNAGGALIGFSSNGTPIGYLQHPNAALALQNQQFRFIQPQALTRMQMSNINPMSIFPHPQQILHPAFLTTAGGNATFISQSLHQNNNSQIPQQFLSISGFNPNQIPTSFMNSLNSQVSHQQQQFHHHQQQQLHHHHQQQQQQQQQQQNQQPKLIPITAIPSTSMTTTTMATSASNPPSLIPHSFSALTAAALIPIAPAPEINASKLLEASTSDDDENEPPPLLDRDETVPASVHEAFVQEATGVRMQYPLLGTEGNEPLRHVIDGYIIEESAVPFKIDDVIKEPLEVLQQFVKQRKIKKEVEVAEQEEKEIKKDIKKITKKSKKSENVSSQNNTGQKKRGRKSNNAQNNNTNIQNGNGNNQTLRSPSPSKSNRKRQSSSSTQQQNQPHQQQQQQQRPSLAKSIKSPPPERPGSSKGPRKSREIEQLISMDFGPKNPIFKTKSVDEYTKGIHRRQQTSLRPVILTDYKERSPEVSREGDEQQCLNCKFTFAQLKLRCEKYPQYCTKECRKEFRKNAKKARQELAEAKSMEPSSSSSSNINEMAAALIGKSPENNGTRKRLSNESETSTVSHHIPIKSSPLKLRIRSSSDLESPASSSQILSPAPSTSTAILSMIPGSSSTPIPINMNTSNGSIPPIASPPPFSLSAGPPPIPNQNTLDFARLTEQVGLNPNDVSSWSAEDVARWVNAITNSQTNGEIFLTEEIDGSSIFMLNQTQITQELGVKFGPTLKIVRAIDWLRNL